MPDSAPTAAPDLTSLVPRPRTPIPGESGASAPPTPVSPAPAPSDPGPIVVLSPPVERLAFVWAAVGAVAGSVFVAVALVVLLALLP